MARHQWRTGWPAGAGDHGRVGAHLLNTAEHSTEVTWWRAGDREVDVVLSSPSGTVALEMASGERKRGLPGLETFGRTYVSSRKLLIGAQGLPLEIALSS